MGLAINDCIVSAETAQTAVQREKEKEYDEERHDDDPRGFCSVDTTKAVETQEIEEDIPEAKPNQGKLILDATCTPTNLCFPTNLGLLNETLKN